MATAIHGAATSVVPKPPPATVTAVTVLTVVGCTLRIVVGLTNDTVADEIYEAVYSRQPISWILDAMLHNDPHGPVDYVLRHPFVVGHNFPLLRLPSMAFAVASMVVVGRWMRHRSWFGVAVTLFTATNSFLVLYGMQARMYSLQILCGTVVAVLAERWLRERDPRTPWLVAAVLAVSMLNDPTGLFLAGGAFLVPGLDRSRPAWRWRAATVAAVVPYAVLLGPTIADRNGVPPTYVPLTTPDSAALAVNGLVSIFYPDGRWLVVVVLAGGGWALHRLDPVLARLALALGAAPFAAIALLGIKVHLLFARPLAILAWVVPVLLAALVERARLRLGQAGGAVVAADALVILLPSLLYTFEYRDGAGASVERMVALVEPGDAVAGYPHHIRYLVAWGFDTDVDAGTLPGTTIGDLYSSFPASPPAGAVPSGRVWVLNDDDLPFDDRGLTRCPGTEPQALDAYTVGCYMLPLARSG